MTSPVKYDLVAWATPPNTTYSEISQAEIDAGTASTLRTITGRRAKYIIDKVMEGGIIITDTGDDADYTDVVYKLIVENSVLKLGVASA